MKDITGEGMFPLQWDRGQGRASAGSDGGGGTQGWSPGELGHGEPPPGLPGL